MPFLASALALSVGLNAYLFFRRRPKYKTNPSAEIAELIRDMAVGGLILVRRVDPQDVLLRSPKRKI